MRLPKNLLSGDYKQPQVFLCQVDKSIIGGLNVTNFTGIFKFNSYDEISFDVDRMYIDNNTGEYCVNPLYDYVEAPRVIYVVDFGYFEIIQSGIVTDGSREYKQCTCYSYEFILSTKYLDLFTINMGTVESIDGVQLYNTADVSKSLIHLVLEKTNGAWTPGHVDINLQTRQRSFEINHETIYDFLLNDVSDTFKCVFEFDTRTNVVNIYDEETYGKSSGVYINKDNLSQSVEINYNGDEIKTRLYVYGDSDLDIYAVNLGFPYIMNLDYYFSKEWMGEDLFNAYGAYCKKVEEKQLEYEELLEEWSKCYDEYYKLYNRVPEYYDNEDIPKVSSKDDLPEASSDNVYEIYKVDDGEKSNYYICKASVIDGEIVYSWQLDIDANVASYLVLPTPSEEYAGIVAKVPNESTGTKYYVCKVSEYPSDKNNWTTSYAWVIANKEEGIKLLKEKEQCYLDIQSIHVAAGFAEEGCVDYQRYTANYNKLLEVQAKIEEEETKAKEKNEQMVSIEADMAVITSSLLLEENFSKEQIIVLNSFIREDEYTDSNFVVTQYSDDNDIMETKRQLKEAAEKELKKISQPQLSFDMSMANLLAIPEFEPVWNDFQLGNSVMVEIRPNYVIKTQILEVEINFDDIADFNVTFGNLTTLTSQIDVHSALMSQAVSAGKSVAQSGSYWKKGADTATSINSRIERGLIDAVTSLKTDSKNQAISFDNRGIHLRRYANEEQTKYENEQIWMNNEKIVFTDDNWASAKMAFGKIAGPTTGEEVYGILAPNIIGTLLAGENLVIDSKKADGETISSFRVDKNGARLYNSPFLLEKENGQILIHPDYGIVAGKDVYTIDKNGELTPNFVNKDNDIIFDSHLMPYNSNFFLDINEGNAYFRGTVYSDGGYFSGTVYADKGDIGGCKIVDGVLKVTDINIDGTISFDTLDEDTKNKIENATNNLNTFINETYANDLQEINQNIIDSKSETFYQSEKPHEDYTNVEESDDYNLCVGDLWYDKDNGKTYVYHKSQNEDGTYNYAWEFMNVPNDVFDKIDGRATIYVSEPTSQNEGDLLIPNEDTLMTVQHEFVKNKVYKCAEESDEFNPLGWFEITEENNQVIYKFFTDVYISDENLLLINSQNDKKAEIWCQDSNPENLWITNASKLEHIYDIWFDKKSTIIIYTHINLSLGVEVDGFGNPFEDIDKKASIYVSQPSMQEKNDFIIPIETFYVGIKSKMFNKGKVYRCLKTSDTFNANDWEEVSYTDDTTANKAHKLAEDTKKLGDKLVSALRFQETEITGEYILTPALGTGYLLVGTENSDTYAKIDGSTGILSCKGANISGHIDATSGRFSGELHAGAIESAGAITGYKFNVEDTGQLNIGPKTDGSGYNFVVTPEGNVTMAGNITLGGVITWSTPPVKYQYSADNVNWHDTYMAGDTYRHESLSGGAWGAGYKFVATDGITKDEAAGIAQTKIDSWCVSSPVIQGGQIQGGSFSDLEKNNWLSMDRSVFGINGAYIGYLQHFFNGYEEGSQPVAEFGYHHDPQQKVQAWYIRAIGQDILFYNQITGKIIPCGNWDFSYCNVDGITASGGVATFG